MIYVSPMCVALNLIAVASLMFNFKYEEELDRFIDTMILHSKKRSSEEWGW